MKPTYCFIFFFLIAFNLKSQVVISENKDTIGKYDIYELTINHPKTYPNNWEDVSITADFSGPENISIDGFFYSNNRWKVRFAPPKEGNWNYTLTFKSISDTYIEKGSFVCNASPVKGFLKRHPTNPFRLIYADGTLFNGIGFGDCILDLNGNGTPHDDWGFDGDLRPPGENRPFPQYYGSTTGIDNYMNAYGANGANFNLFRWSIDNCSFHLATKISPNGNSYSVEAGLWGDTLVETLRKNKFRLWTTFFGYPAFPNINGSTPLEEQAIKKYIKYVMARYGAYTDIWELFNEAFCSEYYLNTITNYVRSKDPYHRPISISAEKPADNRIDVTSPHWYEKESFSESDVRTVEKINEYKFGNKPIIFGEQGNSGQNWDPLSATRMRVRSWTAFFAEGMFIFWNASWTKEYKHPSANIYLGREERENIRALQSFTSIADSGVIPFKIYPSNAGEVRAYGLRSNKYILGYFHHYNDHNSLTNTTFNYRLRRGGIIKWINPEDNKVLQTSRLSRGSHKLTSPSYKIDLAMQIELDSLESPVNLNEPIDILIFPNPTSDIITIEGNFKDALFFELFDSVGKKVLSKNNITNNQKLSIGHLSKGIYFYNIETKEKRKQSGKIILN